MCGQRSNVCEEEDALVHYYLTDVSPYAPFGYSKDGRSRDCGCGHQQTVELQLGCRSRV